MTLLGKHLQVQPRTTGSICQELLAASSLLQDAGGSHDALIASEIWSGHIKTIEFHVAHSCARMSPRCRGLWVVLSSYEAGQPGETLWLASTAEPMTWKHNSNV